MTLGRMMIFSWDGFFLYKDSHAREGTRPAGGNFLPQCGNVCRLLTIS
jgi:hypothetical protein